VAAREPALAWKVAEHLATIVREAGDGLSAHLFLPMSSRVARCLLDTATAGGERLAVRASHQDLADEIGSVREVVSRTLRELTKQGYLTRDGALIVIEDPRRLYSLSLGPA
jgi:CRP/FNR family transcriptional regulator